jgi:uncharacterized membrane protein YdcZ (DUF606 family)
VATNVFLPSFLLAGLAPAVSALTSWWIVAIPLVLLIGFVIALQHSAVRPVFVRDQFAWVWSGGALGAVTAIAGWLLLRMVGPFTLRTAAVSGAAIGLLYILLTTLLIQYMWNAASALAQRGMLAVDKHGEFTQGLSYIDLAINLEPNNAKLYAARADVYFKQGDLVRAQTDVEHALALEPRKSLLNEARPRATRFRGRLSRSVASLHTSRANDPGFPQLPLCRP